MKLDQAARSIFLREFISAFWLAMKYFFKPKATINYPFESNYRSPRLPRRARPAPLPERRGALHRLQALRGDLPGAGDHHRGGAAPQRRHAAHHPLRHRHGEMHLLRLLPGGLPGRRHRRGAELRVRGRDPRGAALRQGQAPRQRRPLGTRARPQHRDGCAVPVNASPACGRGRVGASRLGEGQPRAPPSPQPSPASGRGGFDRLSRREPGTIDEAAGAPPSGREGPRNEPPPRAA